MWYNKTAAAAAATAAAIKIHLRITAHSGSPAAKQDATMLVYGAHKGGVAPLLFKIDVHKALQLQ